MLYEVRAKIIETNEKIGVFSNEIEAIEKMEIL